MVGEVKSNYQLAISFLLFVILMISIFFPSFKLKRNDPDDPLKLLILLFQFVVFQDGYFRFRLVSNPGIDGFVRYRILFGSIRNGHATFHFFQYFRFCFQRYPFEHIPPSFSDRYYFTVSQNMFLLYGVHPRSQLNPTDSVANVLQMLKGASSKVIREEFLKLEEFLCGDSLIYTSLFFNYK